MTLLFLFFSNYFISFSLGFLSSGVCGSSEKQSDQGGQCIFLHCPQMSPTPQLLSVSLFPKMSPDCPVMFMAVPLVCDGLGS